MTMMVRVCRNVAVANVMPFGWIVDFAPRKTRPGARVRAGCCTADLTAVWKAGDKIDVKILEYDKASGRCKLSRYSGLSCWTQVSSTSSCVQLCPPGS